MLDRINHYLQSYFNRKMTPYWIVLGLDILLVILGIILSYSLNYGIVRFANNKMDILLLILLFLPFFLIGFRLFHTYNGLIRYTTSEDLLHIGSAITLGMGFSILIYYLLAWLSIPLLEVRLYFFFSAYLFIFFFTFAMRFIVKLLYGYVSFSIENKHRALIFGAREGGISIALGILSDPKSNFKVCAFVTNEPELTKHRLMGFPVIAHNDTLINFIQRENISSIFVSPLYRNHFIDDVALTDYFIKKGIKVYLQPQEQVWDGHSDIQVQQLRELEIEDLLPREQIEIDLNAVAALITDKCILVTGAAGSIGYEMARQIAKFDPKRLILIDQAETPMHNVRLHMAKHHPKVSCQTIVSSITNQPKMEAIFGEYRPDYVFHAAAYKHVPMMEDNPAEAVQNNIYGTRVIADLAVKYGVKKFVMISTDKAVNPTNVMGCSKRICEIYCQSLNKAIQVGKVEGVTQFITTRFGNVLGSNGSVIPLFEKQIKQGGPVTVTDPNIIRFFMLIPEACRLVLEAGTMGHGGEIYVFDMGKPVRIADLAQRMIDLSGARNVQIEYTGLREGEKLYEEVLSDAEKTQPTPHKKIMVASVREYDYELAKQNEEELFEISQTYDAMKIVAKMKEIVPEYKSQNSPYEVLDK